MSLTLTDLFAGAGGSSTGATQIPGVELQCASNHWQLALDSHNTNHPNAIHICADLSQINPRHFPTTDLLWASPECTNHSIANGRRRQDKIPDSNGDILPDDAAERSRATMWDVPRFAEEHRYQAVVVENVVDAYFWTPFQAWLSAMDALGYNHQLVFLNSMHAHTFGEGAPQSRDRMYVVFWRKGNPAPDLARAVSPRVICQECGPSRGVQTWKRPDRVWGRYRAQYFYTCCFCGTQVEPVYRPAADAIDWSRPGQRIGDRARPLADKTLARIAAGIETYWKPLLVPVEGREGKRAQPVDIPSRTITTRNETGIAIPPFIAELRGGGSKHRLVSQPLATVTASGNHHGLVTAQTVVELEDVTFRMLEPYEYKAAMSFPDDYVLLGNKRAQVRQAGNAVTPPAARDLIGLVAESLSAGLPQAA